MHRAPSLICALIFLTSILTGGLECSTTPRLYCDTEKGSADCSDQLGIPDIPRNSCMIHLTSVCKTIPRPVNMQLVNSDRNASFGIEITPYHLGEQHYPFAFNMTLETTNKDITGYLLFVQHPAVSYNSCRFFDFSKAKRIHPSMNFDLFYDCYTGFANSGERLLKLSLQAIPINQELKYELHVPHIINTAPENLCEWTPVVMINAAGIPQNRVELKFSHPLTPSDHVDEFHIKLKSDKQEYSQTVNLKPEKRMYYTTFEGMKTGKYDVAIVPVIDGQMCEKHNFVPFELLILLDESSGLEWYYFLLCLPILLVVAGIVWYRKITHKKPDIVTLHRPTGVILYSNDGSRHMKVISTYKEFLKKCCGINALVAEEDMGPENPHDWIDDKMRNADFIILVVSPGVNHKIGQRNDETRNQTPRGDGLVYSYHILRNMIYKDPGNVRLIEVVFDPYVDFSPIPSLLYSNVEIFHLMKDWNKFLAFVHNREFSYGCFKLAPSMPGGKYLMCSEGKALQEALDAMRRFKIDGWFNR